MWSDLMVLLGGQPTQRHSIALKTLNCSVKHVTLQRSGKTCYQNRLWCIPEQDPGPLLSQAFLEHPLYHWLQDLGLLAMR